MKKEHMEYFYYEARYISWEEFQECMIKPTDSLDECKRKIGRVTCCFDSHLDKAWNYFKAIYNDIPVEYRMPVMLEEIYQSYRVDYPEMLQYIDRYLRLEETQELKEKRITMVKSMLKNRVRKDGMVKVYRGEAEHFLMSNYAVSFSLDKKVAEFFVEHHKARHGSRFGAVNWWLMNIDNILYYSNERKEREVFVVPGAVQDGYVPETWDDMDYLDEINFEIEYWWAEDMKVLDALWDEEHKAEEQYVS